MNFNQLNQSRYNVFDPRLQSYQSISLKQQSLSQPLPQSQTARTGSSSNAIGSLSDLLYQQQQDAILAAARAKVMVRLPKAQQDLLAAVLTTAGTSALAILSDYCLGNLNASELDKAMAFFAELFPLGADGKPQAGPFARNVNSIYHASQFIQRGGQSLGDYFDSLTEVAKAFGGEWIDIYANSCKDAAIWNQDMSKVYALWGRLSKDAPDTMAWNLSLYNWFEHRPNGVDDFACIIANLGTDQNWGQDRLKDLQKMLYDLNRSTGMRDEMIDTLLLEIRSGTDLGELAAAYLQTKGLPGYQPVQDQRFDQVLSMDRDARTPIVMRQGDAIALYADGQSTRDWTLLESGESDNHEPLFDLASLEPGVHHLLSKDQTTGKLRNPRLQTIIVLPADADPALLTQVNVPEPRPVTQGFAAKIEAMMSRQEEAQAMMRQRLDYLYSPHPELESPLKHTTWYTYNLNRLSDTVGLVVTDEQGQDKIFVNQVWKAYLASLSGAVRNCGCGKKNGDVGTLPGSGSQASLPQQPGPVSGSIADPQAENARLSGPVRQLLSALAPEDRPALTSMLGERYYTLLDAVMNSNSRYVETLQILSQNVDASSIAAADLQPIESGLQNWLSLS